MILIADAGSTKTEWVLTEAGKTLAEVYTQGINPFFQDEQDIEKVFTEELLPGLGISPGSGQLRIFYYGAGCSTPDRCDMVRLPLEKVFPHATVIVDHDLLAAARALFGRQQGIAAILGTGSNSCVYDGEKITANNPSLGFIMGDEGSGAVIGRELLKMYLYNELQPDLREAFITAYHLDKETILNHVYDEPMPNRYCATFMHFVGEHATHPQIKEMVYEAFHEFFKRHVTKYPGYPSYAFACIGSVALIFREQLDQVAHLFGMQVQRVIRKPMDGLLTFHNENS